MDKRKALKIIKGYLANLKKNNINVERAYLFGSYATGNYHKDSDIDLAVIVKDIQDEFELLVQLMKLRSDNEIDIEPHPIDVKEMGTFHPLAAEVERTGIRIV